MNRHTPAVAAVLVAAALGLAGCSAGSPRTTAAGVGTVAAGGPLDLRGACPDKVVVQVNWWPEVSQAAVYHLLGPGARVDTTRKRVVGPLVSQGKDTGVEVELRAGGPAIGFQKVSAQMYLDPSIMLGYLTMDESIELSGKQPTTGVVTPLEIDPLALIWSPKSHPGWATIADIGQTDTKVLYFEGEGTYIDYLVGSGILRHRQVDGGYDGTPARFVASGGTIAVQGFATNEPYLYEKKVRAWGKPVQFALVNDTGYPNYRNYLAIRTGDRQRLAACLRKLVPIVQRSEVDFMADPAPTLRLLTSLVDQYRAGYRYEPDQAEYGYQTLRRLGLVGNGRNNTLGDFDPDRLQRMIDIVVPILTSQNKPPKPDLKPAEIATNDFIDPGIGLPSR